MDAYLLDTSVLSALLDRAHRRHKAAEDAVGSTNPRSTKFVSPISLAEIRFGIRLAERTSGSRAPELQCVLADAEKYAVLDVTKKTAEAYSELKSFMAVTYMTNALRKRRPRWIEDWVDRATGQKLQIDENDLWQCAQARERDLVFVTADRRLQRIAEVVELRLCII